MKRILPLLFLFLTAFPAWAQKDVPRNLNINVYSMITGERVPNAKMELLTADSVVVDSVKGMDSFQYYSIKVFAPGNYILRITHPDYQTAYKNADIKFRRGKYSYYPSPVYLLKKLKKRNYELGEATVSASRVKFYHKGDTLVFDADAFNTADGSMLDGLIKMLPGVELKSDGRIFVNGRYVESLLLNGADFFKGDNRIMLENLPAYMIKHVQTYERQSERNRMAGAEVDKRTYVMDIKLKKQYETGWIANAEAGGGTDSRYLGRLFGLRFTKYSRLALFGNVNNINEEQRPGTNGDWSPSNMLKGRQTTRAAGLDYSVQNTHNTFSIQGNLTVHQEDAENQVQSNRVNFLQEGDTYGRSAENARSKSLRLQTTHEIVLRREGDNGYFNSITPYFSFTHHNRRQHNVGGTFAEDPSGYPSAAILDSLRKPLMGEFIRKTLINRTLNELYSKGDKYLAGSTFAGTYKTDNGFFSLDGEVEYTHVKNHTFDDYRLNVAGQEGSHQNRYTNNRTQAFKAKADFMYLISISDWADGQLVQKRFNIMPGIKLEANNDQNNRLLYRLDQIGQADLPLGTLPSATALLDALDSKNSYDSRLTAYGVEPYFNTHWELMNFGKNNDKALRIDLELSSPVRNEHLDYYRGKDYAKKRTYAYFKPYVCLRYNFKRVDKEVTTSSYLSPMILFDYRMLTTQPDMFLMLDYVDDVDPLLIFRTNPNLRRTVSHNFRLGAYKDMKYYRLRAELTYMPTKDAITMSSTYDKSTGVRTQTPLNIDGNWQGKALFSFMANLGKQKKLSFETRTEGDYHHSVDLIEVVGSNADPRSVVRTLNLAETLRWSYRFNEKYSLAFRVRGNYLNARSSRTDFQDINAGDFDFTLSAQVLLPGKINLSTDIAQYCRRGYNDKAMNTNDLVWNLGLSRSFMQGNLTFRIDGFDILGQLSNVQRTVNVQGRTEQFFNTLPSYFMARVAYRLNKKPKKQ